jgi:hypothetical protein
MLPSMLMPWPYRHAGTYEIIRGELWDPIRRLGDEYYCRHYTSQSRHSP